MNRRTFLSIGSALPLLGCSQPPVPPSPPPAPPRPSPALVAAAAAFDALAAPGVAVALVGTGEPGFVERGVEDLVRKNPVTNATVFQIASLTKPFTAIVILALAEERRLGIDEPARTWIDWLPQAYAGVTLRQLLHHTSGVPRDLRRENVDEFPISEFQTRFLAATPSFAPGEKWEYANTGYTLLALAAEKASGRPFGELLAQRIFQPLGMTSTRYRAPLTQQPGRATGYDWQDDAWKPAALVYSGWGNSGIETTIGDLARFARGLQQKRLLRPASYDDMLKPATLASGTALEFGFRDIRASYGLGWFLTTTCGQQVAFHGGAVAGFSSQLQWALRDNVLVAALANAKSGPDRLGIAEKTAAPAFETAAGCA